MKKRRGSMNLLSRILFSGFVIAGSFSFNAVTPEGQVVGQGSIQNISGEADDPQLIRKYSQHINSTSLSSQVHVLAADSLEGRETGTPSQGKAAAYLAARYRELSLLGKGSEHSSRSNRQEDYFQKFAIRNALPTASTLEVIVGERKKIREIFSVRNAGDRMYFAFGRCSQTEGSLVFAGYGIEDDELGYNDFAALRRSKIGIKDRWVMIVRDEPLLNDSTSLLKTKDGRPSKWINLMEKRLALWKNGAPAGILIVTGVGPRTNTDFATESKEAAKRIDQVNGRLFLESDAGHPFPATFMISKEFADEIIRSAGKTIQEIAERIGKTLQPVVFEVPNTILRANFEQPHVFQTENVLALLEGTDDRLKKEVILVSSHYDHLGTHGGRIYNGAADDASGCVAGLAIAEALVTASKEGHGPRRSILFMNSSGEEKGLVGSRYFTDVNPTIPLNTIVANVNMDGMAGYDPTNKARVRNYLYVVSANEGLRKTAARMNEIAKTDLKLLEGGDWGSDHVNFETWGIPSLYYSTGLTEHYHRPSDRPEAIDYDQMAVAVKLAFATVWRLANADSIPRGNRSGKAERYACIQCGIACDEIEFRGGGICPVCEMALRSKE